MNTYNYRVYGLNIKSEIEIREFIKLDNLLEDHIDINYQYGSMPKRCYELLRDEITDFYEKDEVWFHVKNVASYYICNGNKVIVEPCNNANKVIINIFLMCSCLGFIMLQRGKVAIHGGTVEANGKAIILTGNRGAGKSTLSTALRLKGYKFISDDVAAIDINNDVVVNHGFQYQKLCKDAMNKFGYNEDEVTSFKSDTEMKYIVPVNSEFIYSDTKLFSLIEIIVDDVEEVSIREIKGSMKLNFVIKNIYRGEFMPYWGGITKEYFKRCIFIANNIRCFEMIRPRDKFSVNEQIQVLEDTLNINVIEKLSALSEKDIGVITK